MLPPQHNHAVSDSISFALLAKYVHFRAQEKHIPNPRTLFFLTPASCATITQQHTCLCAGK